MNLPTCTIRLSTQLASRSQHSSCVRTTREDDKIPWLGYCQNRHDVYGVVRIVPGEEMSRNFFASRISIRSLPFHIVALAVPGAVTFATGSEPRRTDDSQIDIIDSKDDESNMEQADRFLLPIEDSTVQKRLENLELQIR